MTATQSHTAASAGEPAPPWPPPLDPDRPPVPPLRATLVRAGVALIAGLVLWLLGARLPALLVAGLGLLTMAVALAVPAVRHRLDRLAGALERRGGQVLGAIVLAGLELLVFLPVWLGIRLTRRDPLALRGSPPGTMWRTLPQETSDGRLYRRQFAREGPLAPPNAHGRAGRPWLALAGLLLALVALDLGSGALIHIGDASRDPRAAIARLSLLASSSLPAARGEPWLAELGLELGHVYYGERYDPFLGWHSPDFSGRYVHVSAGVRASAEPAAGPGAVNVYFFGGSSMFGVFQRDGETIPSDVARLAAARHLPIRVWNLAQIGYVNWQEVLQFQGLLAAGRAPALAVFLDGANDLLAQFRLGPHTVPTHLESADLARRLPFAGVTPPATASPAPLTGLARAYANTSAVAWLIRRLTGSGSGGGVLPTLPPFAGDQRTLSAAAGGDGATLYLRGVTLARRLAAAYGTRVAFFWQPTVFSKRRIAGELTPQALLGTDPVAWRRALAVVEARIGNAAVNLGGALDALAQPVMLDFVHTNEVGARAVARAMFLRLMPTLERLVRRRR